MAVCFGFSENGYIERGMDWDMKALLAKLLLLMLVSGLPVAYPAHLLEGIDHVENQRIESRMIMNLFLDSVDEGKVKIFDKILTRENLQPVSVSHKYQLLEDKLVIHIECKLVPPMPLPNMPQYKVDVLTVETDEFGNIIQLVSRVRPMQTDPEQ